MKTFKQFFEAITPLKRPAGLSKPVKAKPLKAPKPGIGGSKIARKRLGSVVPKIIAKPIKLTKTAPKRLGTKIKKKLVSSFQPFSRFERPKIHIQHIEDSIFSGIDEATTAFGMLSGLAEMFAGNLPKAEVLVSTKWDGAPSIFAGTNPENGKFFVGTKSIFNQSPKINYTHEDIDRNHKGDLAEKLHVALSEFPKLGIDGVLQGDVMFGPTGVTEEVITAEPVYAFTPNTITYAVQQNSALGRRIAEAQIGVVFHTSYHGNTIRGLKPTYGATVDHLKECKSVWFLNFNIQDNIQEAMSSTEKVFSIAEAEDFKAIQTEALIKLCDIGDFADRLQERKDVMSDLTMFINSKVREGTTKFTVIEFVDWFTKRREVHAETFKREQTRKRKLEEANEALQFVADSYYLLEKVFAFREDVTKMKLMLIDKLEEFQAIPAFLRTDESGEKFKATYSEGFVVTDVPSDTTMKLVDRLGFSQANFKRA